MNVLSRTYYNKPCPEQSRGEGGSVGWKDQFIPRHREGGGPKPPTEPAPEPYVDAPVAAPEPWVDAPVAAHYGRTLGDKRYEFRIYAEWHRSNHLGNACAEKRGMLVVLSDLKLGQENGTADSTAEYYGADVIAAEDYYPRVYPEGNRGGMVMPGRNYSSTEYRYGFNGQEKDDEVKSNNESYDFGARMYDPRVGRWWSVDPMEKKYAGFAPYMAFASNPLLFVDPGGRENVIYLVFTSKAKEKLTKSDMLQIAGMMNYYMEHKLGLKTRAYVYDGSMDGNLEDRLDQTDTYVVFGTDVEDLRAAYEVLGSSEEFLEKLRKNTNLGTDNNPETSDSKGKAVMISLDAIDAVMKNPLTMDIGSSTKEWCLFLAMHGSYHNTGYKHRKGGVMSGLGASGEYMVNDVKAPIMDAMLTLEDTKDMDDGSLSAFQGRSALENSKVVTQSFKRLHGDQEAKPNLQVLED